VTFQQFKGAVLIFIAGVSWAFCGIAQEVPAKVTAASDSLQVLLERSLQAERTVAYEGVVVMEWPERDGRVIRKKVWSYPPSSYREDFLTPIPPRIRSVVWANQRVAVQHRDGHWRCRKFRRNPFRRPLRFYDLDLTRNNYRVAFVEAPISSPRPVVGLMLTPRFPHRFALRLYFDRQTGLVLRREKYLASNGDWKVVHREYFETFVQLDSIPARIFQIPEDARFPKGPPHRWGMPPKTFSSLDSLQQQVPFPIFVPRPPEGFRLTLIQLLRWGRRTIVHLHYTDGLMKFSLFQTKGPPKRVFERMKRHWGGRQKVWMALPFLGTRRIKSLIFFLVGDGPPELFNPILDSLEPLVPSKRTLGFFPDLEKIHKC